MKNSNNQNGRSMIEMLGVLAIIGVLSVGGIAGYSKAMMKYRINKTIEQVSMIRANVQTLFSRQQDFVGLDSTTDDGKSLIKKAKLVPDEMWDGDRIRSVFGSDVEIGNETSHYGKFFYIQYKDIPQEACIELATLDWASNIAELTSMAAYEETKKQGLSTTDLFGACDRGVTFDGLTFVPACDKSSLPITLDDAVIGCSCSSDTCGIYWGFSK